MESDSKNIVKFDPESFIRAKQYDHAWKFPLVQSYQHQKIELSLSPRQFPQLLRVHRQHVKGRLATIPCSQAHCDSE